MKDPKLRLACVDALKDAGFKLTKHAFTDSASFSRFYHEARRISEMNDESAVLKAVQHVLGKAKDEFPRVETVLKQVFKRHKASSGKC